MLLYTWVAETGSWPRELEMIYRISSILTVPETRPGVHALFRDPISSIVISVSLVLRPSLMIKSRKSRVMPHSTRISIFNSVLPHPIPLSRPTTTIVTYTFPIHFATRASLHHFKHVEPLTSVSGPRGGHMLIHTQPHLYSGGYTVIRLRISLAT